MYEKNDNEKRFDQIQGKVHAGERLCFEDGVFLYNSHDIVRVGQLADFVRKTKHSKNTYYIYNQHLNYTNVCVNRCLFCAYARDDGEDGAFTLTLEEVRDRLKMAPEAKPVKELHVVGGLNPELSFDYYTDLLKTIKNERPDSTIKAFTAVEIDYLARIGSISVEETIKRLMAAGLEMMPGGGAEVLCDRIGQTLFPKKIGKSRWLEIVEAVHTAGLKTNATMLYGHIETVEERVNHLIELRSLQDKTGGFSAFIPLAFHSANTELNHMPETTAFDDLKNVAVARLLLDNFDHIKAYWVMIGEKLAQIALSFGADDLDGTIIEEKITHMAGAQSAKGLTKSQMTRLISMAGYIPVERDSFYNPV